MAGVEKNSQLWSDKVETHMKVTSLISEFATTDLTLASFLRVKNVQIIDMRRVTENQVEFIFKNVDKQMLLDFNAEKTRVEPKTFSSMSRHLLKSARLMKQM